MISPAIILAFTFQLYLVIAGPSRLANPKYQRSLQLPTANSTHLSLPSFQQATNISSHDFIKKIYPIRNSDIILIIFSNPDSRIQPSATALCLDQVETYAHRRPPNAPLYEPFRSCHDSNVRFTVLPARQEPDLTWSNVAIVADALFEFFSENRQWLESDVFIEVDGKWPLGSCSIRPKMY